MVVLLSLLKMVTKNTAPKETKAVLMTAQTPKNHENCSI